MQNHPFQLATAVLLCWCCSTSVGASAEPVAVVELAPYEGIAPIESVLEDLPQGATTIEVVELAELLAADLGRWTVSPPARLLPCTGAPASPTELEAALDETETLLVGLEYEAADAGLQQLSESLCACSRPVDRGLQTRILFLWGIVRFYTDDRDAARNAFDRAARISPDLEWDTAFPPDAQQVFLQGLADAVRAPKVRFVPPSGADARLQVFVDGMLVPEEGIRVSAARHVIQIDDGTSEQVGGWVEPGAAGEIALVPLETARDTLRSSTPEDGAGSYYPALMEAARERGHARLLVVPDVTRESGWWCDLEQDECSAIQLVDTSHIRRARAHQAGGIVLLGTGAALAGVGTALAATHRADALEMLPQMESSAAYHDMSIDEYSSHRNNVGGGIGLAAAGGACVAIGVALLVRGATLERSPAEPTAVGALVTPDGAWVTLSGRW